MIWAPVTSPATRAAAVTPPLLIRIPKGSALPVVSVRFPEVQGTHFPVLAIWLMMVY